MAVESPGSRTLAALRFLGDNPIIYAPENGKMERLSDAALEVWVFSFSSSKNVEYVCILNASTS